MLQMHFWGAFLEKAPHRLTSVDPSPKVNMEMIVFSTSTAHSVFGNQVSVGASGDLTEGSSSSEKSTHLSLVIVGGAAPIVAVIDLLVE